MFFGEAGFCKCMVSFQKYIFFEKSAFLSVGFYEKYCTLTKKIFGQFSPGPEFLSIALIPWSGRK